MALVCFVFLVCSIRTNLIFFLIFFTLVPTFALLAGSYLQLAQGQAVLAVKLAEASGAFAFVTCMLGWYIFFAIMLASVDFPFDLPRKLMLQVLIAGIVLTYLSGRSFWHSQGREREAQG